MKRTLDTHVVGSEKRRVIDNLSKSVLGQDDAIEVVADAWQRYRLGIHAPGRPLANLLFLGPTGTGKTRLVEAFAEFVHGTPRGVTKVDCGEFQYGHEIAKVIGSPPGYLGHRETPPLLSRENIKIHGESRAAIVLFDEIEKAHDNLWNLLLGILDKGSLTLGDNRRVDFQDVFVFMTGNLGVRDMQTLTRPRGFAPPTQNVSHTTLTSIAVEAARRKFPPEFMNRIDATVVFRSLSTSVLKGIVANELDIVQNRFANKHVALRATSAAVEALLNEGVSSDYGARQVKRVIEQRITYRLTNLLASNQLQRGDTVRIGYRANAFTFDLDEQVVAEASA